MGCGQSSQNKEIVQPLQKDQSNKQSMTEEKSEERNNQLQKSDTSRAHQSPTKIQEEQQKSEPKQLEQGERQESEKKDTLFSFKKTPQTKLENAMETPKMEDDQRMKKENKSSMRIEPKQNLLQVLKDRSEIRRNSQINLLDFVKEKIQKNEKVDIQNQSISPIKFIQQQGSNDSFLNSKTRNLLNLCSNDRTPISNYYMPVSRNQDHDTNFQDSSQRTQQQSQVFDLQQIPSGELNQYTLQVQNLSVSEVRNKPIRVREVVVQVLHQKFNLLGIEESQPQKEGMLPPTPTYNNPTENKQDFNVDNKPKKNQLAIDIEKDFEVQQLSLNSGNNSVVSSCRSAGDRQKQSTLSPQPSNKRRRCSNLNTIETSVLRKTRDEKGNKKINNYIVMHDLGRGGFGKVKQVFCPFKNEHYAMKVANKSKLRKKLLTRKTSAYTLLEQEIAILKKLDHPNCVKLIEVIDDPDNDKLYLIMELVRKGAIGSRTYWKSENIHVDDDAPLPAISPERIRKYARDFLLGLDYLHNYGKIIHRDIKPDNLLVDDHDNLKIADFGVAQLLSDDADEIIGESGTKSFLTPELFLKKPVKGRNADIWAAGVTFYMIAFGKPPFFAKTLEELKDLVIHKEEHYPEDCDHHLKAFIKCCLEKNAYKRASLEQLMDHPFITLDGQVPLMEQDYDEEGLEVDENDIKSAITRLTLRATVFVTAKLKSHVNKTRERLKKRQSQLT